MQFNVLMLLGLASLTVLCTGLHVMVNFGVSILSNNILRIAPLPHIDIAAFGASVLFRPSNQNWRLGYASIYAYGMLELTNIAQW